MDNHASHCKKYKERIKRECFALYGSVCARCNFSDIRALQLDHDKVRPNRRRDEYGRGSTGLYIAILRGKENKEDYQCLCSNCNWIKRSETPSECDTRHKTSVRRYF